MSVATEHEASRPLALRLHNLTLTHQRHPAVHHLNVEIPHGELLAIMGPNGAGKSTLLSACAGLMLPTTGSIHIGTGLGSDSVAYLPQQHQVDRQFPITVLDLVLMGTRSPRSWWQGVSDSDRARAFDALTSLGLTGLEGRLLSELSAGQFQRVLFARLVLQDATLILLDEPFNGLDEMTLRTLLLLIAKWHTEGRTVITVLHDEQLARKHFPTTLLLAKSLIAYGQTALILDEHWHRMGPLSDSWDDESPMCEVRP